MRGPRRYFLVFGTIILIVFTYIYVVGPTYKTESIGISSELEIERKPPQPSSAPRSWVRKFANGRPEIPDIRSNYKQAAKISTRQDEPLLNETYVGHLKDVLESGQDASQFDFARCRMSNCFDFSRCSPAGPLRVHIIPGLGAERNELNLTGESNIIHKKILKIIANSEHFEPEPSKACVFILEDDTIDRDPLSRSFNQNVVNIFQSKYSYGMNHLVFNLYSGSWPDYREDDFAGLKFGAAILAKASNSITHHRNNFDISIPLFSYLHGTASSSGRVTIDEDDQRRKYFLSFKGKRYVVGTGSRTRNSLHHLNNQRDVITLTTCRHGKKWIDAKDARCTDDESSYNNYDFIDLMRHSTFCLTPRGRRLGSFRFLEALEFGCIPVILSDGWVWPFEELIDWSEAAIQFDETLLLLVPDMLRDIGEQEVREMRGNCRKFYANYLSTIEKIVKTTLQIIERRVKNHFRIKQNGLS